MASVKNFMVDGYFGGVSSVGHETNSPIMQSPDIPKSGLKETRKGHVEEKQRNTSVSEIEIEKMNSRSKTRIPSLFEKDANGLTIIPWEEFVKNPRRLNEMFYLESNGIITYDPEDVNVFFHATRMNRPTFGDISEDGKAWILTVEKREELEYLRKWLTERVSVFGVTLVKKGKRFAPSYRAPCLLTLNPKVGCLGEKINSALNQAISSMKANKKFCVEINLNSCVEQWSENILAIDCRAVGAKLIITNGEQKDEFNDLEDYVCCVACFPIWALQLGIYKIHRRTTYTDYILDLGTEPLYLHGAAGSVDNQRKKLFKDYERGPVFRTKPDENGLSQMADNSMDTDAYKYICVKKYERKEGKETKTKLVEYKTTNLKSLVSKKVFKEEINIAIVNDDGNIDESHNITDDAKFNAFIKQEVQVEFHTDEYKKTFFEDATKGDLKSGTSNQIELGVFSEGKGMATKPEESTEIHSFREDIKDVIKDEQMKVKRANWDIDNELVNGDVVIGSNTPPSATTANDQKDNRKVRRDSSKLDSSFKFQQMPVVKEEVNGVGKNKHEMEPGDSDDSSTDAKEKVSSANPERYDVAAVLKNRHHKADKDKTPSDDVKALDSNDYGNYARTNISFVKESDNGNINNPKVIPVSKTEGTDLFDTTDFDDESKILNDNDVECCDVEDLETPEDTTNEANTSHKHIPLQTNERRRGRPQYDSRRKYLGVPTSKKQTKTPVQDATYADVNL